MAIKGPVRGAYEIKELVMVDFSQTNQIDLAPQVQSLMMKESIYQPYIQLDIIVEDTTALHEQVPLLGEEMIFFTWCDGEGVSKDTNRLFRKIFYVVSITQMKDPKPTAQTYTIRAYSPEYFQSKKVKVYGGWNSELYSSIAQDVYDKWIARPLSKRFKGYEKSISIEPTKGGYNFCCPGWEPIETLNWLASKSVSQTKGSTGALYFFWESMHGLHFKSIETILQKTNEFAETEMQAKIPQIHLVPANIGGGDGTTLAYDQNVPDEYNFPLLFDSASKVENGMIANRVVGLDFMHQTVLNYDYYYDKDGKLNGHAYGKNTLNSSVSFLNPDADLATKQGKFPVVSVAAVSGSGGDTPVKVSAGEGYSRMHRTSQLEQIRQLQIEAMLPYNAEYETGSLCYVFIPSRSGTMNTSLNGLTSGKYLITGMEHLLIGGLWKLRVKLVKESLLQNLDDALDLTTGGTENTDEYSGKPVAGGVSVKKPQRVSAQNASLDPLDEETYKLISFHELSPPDVGPSSS